MQTVVRLGRAETSVLVAQQGGRELDIEHFQCVEVPSLTFDGSPNRAAGPVLRGLLAEAGDPEEVTVLLPPGASVFRRVEVEMPVRGLVSHAVLEDALDRARREVGRPAEALLTCQPSRTFIDGEPVSGDPVGQRARILRIEMTALSAPIALLGRFETAIGAAGSRLAGVVSAQEAAAAALLPRGEGSAVRVAFGGTVAVHASAGALAAGARVPIGRRHLIHDVAEILHLDPAEAEARLESVLSGRPDEDAERVIQQRLAELSELLVAACAEAGIALEEGQTVLSGLPAAALAHTEFGMARPVPKGAVPGALANDPLLAGAAMLVCEMRGHRDRPSAWLEAPKRMRLLDWLRRNF